jgi:hypothetical protein
MAEWPEHLVNFDQLFEAEDLILKKVAHPDE